MPRCRSSRTSGGTPTSLKPMWRKPSPATSSSTARQSPTVRSPEVNMKMKSTRLHHRSRRDRRKGAGSVRLGGAHEVEEPQVRFGCLLVEIHAADAAGLVL